MTEEDAQLVALIDGELDEASRDQLLARLARDEALRQRYDALRAAGAPIVRSLAALLDEAPLARLSAGLPQADANRAAARRRPLHAWRQLAAGIAIGLVIAGAGGLIARSFAPASPDNDWRDAIAGYAELYTADTFARDNPDAALEAEQLRALDEKIVAAATPETITLAGLRFKTAQILGYEGKPLGQIVFADAMGEPILFCMLNGVGADAPTRSQTRGELALASWARGGRGYMVIGRLPATRVADLAATLAKRF